MATPLSALHEPYASGTNYFIQWLIENAPRSSISSVPTSSDDSEVIVLSVRHIKQLARDVVESAVNSYTTPKGLYNVVVVLQDVASKRREAMICHKTRGREDPNGGHEHFVDALTEILHLLKASISEHLKTTQAKQRKSARRATGSHSNEQTVQNIYDQLQLEESFLQMDLAAITESLAVRDQPKLNRPRFKLEQQEDDAQFALWCHLKECAQLREFIKQVWGDFVAGKHALSTAAEVTDKALVMLHHACYEFASNFSQLSSVEKVAEFVNLDVSMEGNTIKKLQCKGSDDTSASDFLCLPAVLLAAGLSNPPKSSGEQITLHYLRQLYPAATRVMMMVLEFRTDFSKFQQIPDHAGMDTMTNDILHATSPKRGTRKTSYAAIMGLQIYIDITAIMKTSNISHLAILYAATESAKAKINVFDERLENAVFGHTFDSNNVAATARSKELDPMEELQQCIFTTQDCQYTWLSESPILCGLTVNAIDQRMYWDGLAACDENGTVLCITHLYRACRRAGYLTQDWPDMKAFISQTPACDLQILETKSPKTPMFLAAKHFALAVGAESIEFSKERQQKREGSLRPPLPDTRKAEQRHKHLRAANIKAREFDVTGTGLCTSGHSANQESYRVMLRTIESIMADTTSKIDPDLRKRWKKTKRLTSTETLRVLLQAYARDVFVICYDHHKLMLQCCQTMDRLKNDPICQKRMLVHRFLKHGCSFIELTDAVLWEAANTEREGWRPISLMATASVFQDFIDQGHASDIIEGQQRQLDAYLCDLEHDVYEPSIAPERNSQEAASMTLVGSKLSFFAAEVSEEQKQAMDERIAMMKAQFTDQDKLKQPDQASLTNGDHGSRKGKRRSE